MMIAARRNEKLLIRRFHEAFHSPPFQSSLMVKVHSLRAVKHFVKLWVFNVKVKKPLWAARPLYCSSNRRMEQWMAGGSFINFFRASSKIVKIRRAIMCLQQRRKKRHLNYLPTAKAANNFYVRNMSGPHTKNTKQVEDGFACSLREPLN